MQRKPFGSSPAAHVVAMLVVIAVVTGASRSAAAPSDAQKCGYAKTKALGNYYACLLQAEATAFKKNVTPDVAPCDQRVHDAFAKIAAKYGALNPGNCINFDIAQQPFLVGRARRESLDMACLATTGAGIDRGGTITAVAFSATLNPTTLSVRNTTNLPVQHARCFYADAACLHSAEFTIDVPAQDAVAWDPSNPPAGIPALPSASFSGDLVCVNVDDSGIPLAGNSLIASVTDAAECPRDGVLIRDFDTQYAAILNSQLCLGSPVSSACPNGAELDPCPYDLLSGTPYKARMEGCWSSVSSFVYHCQP